jgi:hypothetical protein
LDEALRFKDAWAVVGVVASALSVSMALLAMAILLAIIVAGGL